MSQPCLPPLMSQPCLPPLMSQPCLPPLMPHFIPLVMHEAQHCVLC
jgi:hypothetical protein